MNFYRRVNDRWKRGIFFFKILSRLSRYDSRFSRYRRAKEKVIFRRSPVSFHSPLALSNLTLPKFTDTTEEETM